MKFKILSILLISLFSTAYSQNLNFSDSKFKALMLSSSPDNDIAKDLGGNSIAIDANSDGEIQLSEAQNVAILNVKIDEAKKYTDYPDNTEIDYSYYFSHLPDTITDVLSFTNLEELYIADTKSANISFVNNSKIKKVICTQRWYTIEESFNGNYYDTGFYPVDFTIDNCPAIVSMDDISASYHPYFSGSATFRIKNNPQLNGALILNNKLVSWLIFENQNFTSIDITDCNGLSKLSVPNMTSLQNITIKNNQDGFNYDQNIDLIANNCTALQGIICDGDYYDSRAVYISSANLNGCSALKKIKGLNMSSIDFSAAGLTSLEELDCAYYNRYIYFTGYPNTDVVFGDVGSINLAGLPSLKVLKAFNQKISNVSFANNPSLEYVDVSNTTSSMTSLTVSDLFKLTTLKAGLYRNNSDTPEPNLLEINAKNCILLKDIEISQQTKLKKLNFENCSSLTDFSFGDAYFDQFNVLESVNFKDCSSLKNLTLYHTQITTLDLSDCHNLETLRFGYNEKLSELNIKNGAAENVSLASTTTATICADQFQVNELRGMYPDAIVNSNCDSTLATQNSDKNSVSVYPNPARDIVSVKSANTIKNIIIYDVQGKLILNKNASEKDLSIDVSKYLPGVYYLRIKTNMSDDIRKIIKN